MAPFAKTGGLADVAGALPLELNRAGIDVRVAMPGYGSANYGEQELTTVLPHMDVSLGPNRFSANVTAGTLPGSDVPIYFINNPDFFNRLGLYQEDGKDYPDNPRRFAFFCKVVAWLIKGLGWTPDVIHCNDWQTALLPVMLATEPGMADDPDLSKVATLFTIHNMAYQGNFDRVIMADLGLSPQLYSPTALEYYTAVNFMKGGILFSTKLSTVSPTYAREIQTSEYGCGLDGVLRGRSADLTGILNGIDYNAWNPETDTHLSAPYSATNLAGKAQCKRELQRQLGLKDAPDTPLLVMISRLDPQKGFDLLIPLLPQIMQMPVQLAILGTGRADYESQLSEAAKARPGQMAVTLKFDNGLAHQMEAGGDIFLMPSRFEPCGLNQLYSLRYGTLPLVRRTGGLADSVEPMAPNGRWGTGFTFDSYTAPQFMTTLRQALALYNRPELFKAAQVRAMQKDFSWQNSAREYLKIYDQCASEPRP